MAIENAYIFIGEIFNQTTIFGFEWLWSLIIITLTLIIITRDLSKWGEIALPVSIGWYLAGLNVFIGVFFVTAIWFVLTNLSINVMGNIINHERFKDLGIINKFKNLSGNIFKSVEGNEIYGKPTKKRLTGYDNITDSKVKYVLDAIKKGK